MIIPGQIRQRALGAIIWSILLVSFTLKLTGMGRVGSAFAPLRTTRLAASRADSTGAVLLFTIGMHIEPFGAVPSQLVGGGPPVNPQGPNYNNRAFFDRHVQDIQTVVSIVEQHGGRMTVQAQTAFTRVAAQSGETILADLEARGHEIGLHFHEDAHLGRNPERLPAETWCAVMKEEIGFIYQAGVKKHVRYWSGGNLYPGLLDAASCAGLDVNSDWKNPRTQRTDEKLLGVNPWRPAAGPSADDVAQFGQHDPTGKIIFLPEGNYSRTDFASMRRTEGIGDAGYFEFLKGELYRSLDAARADRVNVFHFTVHAGEFRGNPSQPFAVIDQWLTEVIDPLVKEGKVRWATFSEMADAYIAWEQANSGVDPRRGSAAVQLQRHGERSWRRAFAHGVSGLLSPPADPRFGAVFFSTELNVTELPCADLQRMGIRSTFFGAFWKEIERQPGHYDWSPIDGPVDAALACGVDPLIKVSSGSNPGDEDNPPQDLEAYTHFVFDLVQHLKGRVHSYAIQNEIDKSRYIAWTAEAYGRVRAAAYESIKRADPQAQVLDSGLTMGAYLAARANELVQAGQVQEAFAMLDRFETYMRRKEHKLPGTEKELDQWLSSPTQQRSLGLVQELYTHPETFDAVQLHYLQDAWELTPEYIGWVRTWLAKAGTPDKPLEFWEIGFGWEGEETGKEFTEEGHAQGVVKALVITLGEGASRVIYEPYWEEVRPGTGPMEQSKFGRGFMTPNGPRLAATAYQTMASQLSGYQNAEPVNLGAEVWAYRFVTPRGDVYVVWAKGNTTVRLPVAAAQVTATDITGGTTKANPAALPVGTDPIFVSAAPSSGNGACAIARHEG